MQRFRLTIEYDGGGFVGWQRQDNGPSVQAALEEAVRRFANEEVAFFAAGRTDAGVHALAMTAHVDIAKEATAPVVRDALNYHLKPSPIAVIDAQEVGEHFHARFSARARHYLYRIICRRAPLALEAGRAWRIGGALDAENMNKAAQCLIGKHDFTTFRAAQCQSATPVKTLTSISVTAIENLIEIRASAPSFLHHQVRSIVGSLVEVGLGKWTAADLSTALSAKDRSACGPVAPACGLYFVKADY